ncbi:MAG: hypothetical protein ABSH25_22610 [Syntrophorhabdales bacterium]|jgi:hypothetical protein
MASTKYGRYIITNPIPHPRIQEALAHHVQRHDRGYQEGWKRPGEGKFLPQADLPECQMRCVIARQVGVPDPQPFLDAHKHSADELITFLSTSDDAKLGATVEIQMGDEREAHVFDQTTVIYAPKGLVHGPIWYRDFEEGRVFYMITLMLQAEYD